MALFRISVDKKMVKNALADVKRTRPADNQAFGFISSFLCCLAETNEGTTTSLMSENGVFQRAFLCPAICRNAFAHTAKISGLDACHIKAHYGGSLLVMTALDGNGQIFPIALGVAESENTATWTWFISLLKTALHIQDDGQGLVFLSDREKGIEAALDDVLPRAAHAYCVFHIEKNVKSRYYTKLGGLIFQAARAGTETTFEDTINRMKAMNKAAGAYVDGIDKNKWARAFFPTRRFGHVTSNIAESENAWLEEDRYKDPVGLFMTYIWRLNTLFDERRREYAAMPPDRLPTRVFDLLKGSADKAPGLRVRQHTAQLFEVQRLSDQRAFRVVNLADRTCTCGFHSEYGVPCRHIAPRSSRRTAISSSSLPLNVDERLLWRPTSAPSDRLI